MVLGRVCGTVVATLNADRADRGRYLLVAPVDARGEAVSGGGALVALDLVGAEREQVVLVSQGSSARNATETQRAAVDAVVIGIVDIVDVAGTTEGYRAS